MPPERLGIDVASLNVFAHGFLQFFDTGETSVAHAVSGDLAEESLHEIKPRAGCGGVVHLNSCVFCKPLCDVGMLMGRVVVGDDVDVEPGWRLLVDLLEEVEPFDVGVGLGITLKDIPRGIVEGGEQRCRSMARIVMRERLDVSDSQRKPRLSPLQCLTLRLLVAAEHDRLFRGREIQADDIPELGEKVRIIRNLERARQVGFDFVAVPNCAYRVLGNPDGAGHASRRVARAPRRRRGRLGDDALHGLRRNPRLSSTTGFLIQPHEPFIAVAIHPLLNRHAGRAQRLGCLAL